MTDLEWQFLYSNFFNIDVGGSTNRGLGRFLTELLQRVWSEMVIGIAVFRLLAFILSALLHLGLMFALHRSERLHKFQPSYKLDEQKIPLKPNMFVEDQHLDRVRNEIFQWRNQSLLLLESQLMETKELASARTYAHLDRQMHRV